MSNQNKQRKISLQSMVASKFFRQGAADYHAGRWSEVSGTWYRFSAADIYERGRLVAAYTGAKKPQGGDYMRAKMADAIPPGTPR